MINEVNNAMFSKKFNYNHKVSSIVNNFKDETYPNPQFVTPNSNMMYHGQPSPFGSPFGNNMSPLNMFPTMFNDQRFQSHYNMEHDPMFANSDMNSSRERLRNVIEKTKQKVNGSKNRNVEVKMEKGNNYNIESKTSDVESNQNSPLMLTVPSDDETVMDDDVEKKSNK